MTGGRAVRRVRRERGELLGPQPGQLAYVVLGEHALRVREGRLQPRCALRAPGQYVDLQGVGDRHRVRPGVEQPATGRVVPGEPAQVGEADVGSGQPGQGRAGLGVEVAQQAPAESRGRHRPQLLLDLLERRGSGVRAEVEADRVLGDEPADGARDVHGCRQCLASVSLQVEQEVGTGAAPADGRADQGGEQDGVGTAVEGAGEGDQGGPGQFGVHVDGDDGAAQGAGRPARPVVLSGQQPGLSGGAQPGRPPVQFVDHPVRLGGQQPRPPGERGARVRRGLTAVRQQPCQLLPQHPPGHSVDGQVMHQEQQQTRPLGPGVEPDGPQHLPPLRIQYGGARRRLGEVCRVGAGGDGDPLRAYGGGARLQFPVGGRGVPDQSHAQGGVTVGQGRDGGADAVLVDAVRHGERHGLDERAQGAALFAPPAHDRGEREAALGQVGAGRLLGGGRAGRQGQAGRGAGGEDVPRGEEQAGRRGPGGELDGHDAVAAEPEEVGVHIHRFGAEDLGVQGAQGLFGGGGDAGDGGRGGRAAGGRGGQGGFVDLSVGGQRERAEDDHVGRDQAGGQTFGRVGEQGVRVRGVAGDRDDVSDQLRAAGPALPDESHGSADGGVFGEDGRDLGGLRAQAAQFHLVVGAAQIVEGAVVVLPGEVAGAVHAGARGAVGVGGEAVRRLRGAVQVAVGQGTGEVQLALRARGDRAESVVEQAYVRAGEGTAQGRARLPALVAERLGERDGDRRLGGAVRVVEAAAVHRPARHQLRRAGLRADGEHPQVRVAAGRYGRQHGRCRHDRGHPPPRQHPPQVLAHQHPGRRQYQCRAGAEGHAQVGDRYVEGRGAQLEHPVPGAQVQPVRQGPCERGQSRVRDDDALGGAGGAGGVDDVGGGGRVRVGGGERLALVRLRAQYQYRYLAGSRRRVVRDDQHRVRVGQRAPQAFRGVLGIEGQIRGARPLDGQRGHRPVRAAAAQERHEASGAGPEPGQGAGQPVHAVREFAVRQGPRAGVERGRVRGAGGLAGHQLGQRDRRRRGGAGRQAEQAFTQARRHDAEVAHPHRRVRGDLPQQLDVALGPPRHRLR